MFNSRYEELVYLAGQAPDEPQPWFKPSMPQRPNSGVYVSADGKRKYTSAYVAEQFKGEMHDGKCMFVTRTEITK